MYHAAGMGTTSVREIAEIVVAAAGRTDTRIVYAGGDRGWPGDVPRFRYDISRLQALGWQPAAPLDRCGPLRGRAHSRQWLLIGLHACRHHRGRAWERAPLAMTADRIPKALLPVGGVPIIFRQMRVLRREGVTRVTVLAGHLGDRLAPALGAEAAALGLAAAKSLSKPQPLGTAGLPDGARPRHRGHR